jgi:2-keto-3-deoxy-6-phosphogluconate aldolase
MEEPPLEPVGGSRYGELSHGCIRCDCTVGGGARTCDDASAILSCGHIIPCPDNMFGNGMCESDKGPLPPVPLLLNGDVILNAVAKFLDVGAEVDATGCSMTAGEDMGLVGNVGAFSEAVGNTGS